MRRLALIRLRRMVNEIVAAILGPLLLSQHPKSKPFIPKDSTIQLYFDYTSTTPLLANMFPEASR